jgi:hypothetical protein
MNAQIKFFGRIVLLADLSDNYDKVRELVRIKI